MHRELRSWLELFGSHAQSGSTDPTRLRLHQGVNHHADGLSFFHRIRPGWANVAADINPNERNPFYFARSFWSTNPINRSAQNCAKSQASLISHLFRSDGNSGSNRTGFSDVIRAEPANGRDKKRAERKEKEKKGKTRRKRPPEAREGVGRDKGVKRRNRLEWLASA